MNLCPSQPECASQVAGGVGGVERVEPEGALPRVGHAVPQRGRPRRPRPAQARAELAEPAPLPYARREAQRVRRQDQKARQARRRRPAAFRPAAKKIPVHRAVPPPPAPHHAGTRAPSKRARTPARASEKAPPGAHSETRDWRRAVAAHPRASRFAIKTGGFFSEALMRVSAKSNCLWPSSLSQRSSAKPQTAFPRLFPVSVTAWMRDGGQPFPEMVQAYAVYTSASTAVSENNRELHLSH